MHIPPYFKKRSWQYFLIGAFFGGIIAYVILLFMYGTMYETLYQDNLTLRNHLEELKSQNEALLKAKEDSEEKVDDELTIQRIDVSIANANQLQLDRLIIYELEGLIKQDLNHVIGQKIQVISETSALLISAIENKTYLVDNFSYQFETSQLTISQTLKVILIAKIS